jgi:hypothetical protein
VCDQVDERENNPKLKVLCWEDIDLWILRYPDGNGGRDRLAMHVLLRWHKGENKKIVPTCHIKTTLGHPSTFPHCHSTQLEGVDPVFPSIFLSSFLQNPS